MRPDHRWLEAPAGEATAVDTAGSWQESVPMNFLLVLMVLLVIVLTYMTRHGGYGP